MFSGRASICDNSLLSWGTYPLFFSCFYRRTYTVRIHSTRGTATTESSTPEWQFFVHRRGLRQASVFYSPLPQCNADTSECRPKYRFHPPLCTYAMNRNLRFSTESPLHPPPPRGVLSRNSLRRLRWTSSSPPATATDTRCG